MVFSVANYLVIGAGGFGRRLICALQHTGGCVDVIDKEASASCGLEGCYRFFCDNALNLSTVRRLDLSSYACCFLCVGGESWMRNQITARLHQAGAKRIIVRIYDDKERKTILSAGAEEAVSVEQLASEALMALLQKTKE